jgi:hypothetical protein
LILREIEVKVRLVRRELGRNLAVNVRPVAYRENFKSVVDIPEYDAVVANAKPETVAPFAMERLNVA